MLMIARQHLQALGTGDMHRVGEAWRLCQEVLAHDPAHTEALRIAGFIALTAREPDVAERMFRAALEHDPCNGHVYYGLAVAMMEAGRLAEGLEALRQAVACAPDNSSYHSALLTYELYAQNYDHDAFYASVDAWRKRHGRSRALVDPGRDPDPDRLLRIGLCAPNFGGGAGLMTQIGPLLEHYDRDQFAVYAYTYRPMSGLEIDRIGALARDWRCLEGVGDQAAARMIRDDEIDILVCLLNHTGDESMTMYTYRPAPILVSFHGLQSTGVEAMDYWLTDRVLHPADTRERFGETLAFLPHFFNFSVLRDAPDPGEPPALTGGGITFGCFKIGLCINDRVAAAWARVLSAVPGSRLLLKSRGLGYGQTAGTTAVLATLTRNGVDPERVRLAPPADTFEGHLAAYRQVDVYLDTFPYCGCLTVFDALTMGVPVVTLSGDRCIGRMAQSLLHSAGLEEWVADDVDGYVARAVALAGDIDGLATIRAGLRDRVAASPLCDGPAYARGFEAALRDMWRRWCREQAQMTAAGDV